METKRVYTFGNGHAEGKADMRNLLGGCTFGCTRVYAGHDGHYPELGTE